MCGLMLAFRSVEWPWLSAIDRKANVCCLVLINSHESQQKYALWDGPAYVKTGKSRASN